MYIIKCNPSLSSFFFLYFGQCSTLTWQSWFNLLFIAFLFFVVILCLYPILLINQCHLLQLLHSLMHNFQILTVFGVLVRVLEVLLFLKLGSGVFNDFNFLFYVVDVVFRGVFILTVLRRTLYT